MTPKIELFSRNWCLNWFK